MISDTIYDHLKDIHSSKVKPLISKATLVEPEDTISKVIGKMKKNDIYDVFYFDGKKVLILLQKVMVSEIYNQQNCDNCYLFK